MKKLFKFMILAFCLLLLESCSNDKKNKNDLDAELTPTVNATKVVIDASAGGVSASLDSPSNKYTYFNFKTGKVVELADSEAKNSMEWDIAFKRTSIILNSGVSGPGSISGYCMLNNSEAYDDLSVPNLEWFEESDSELELKELDNLLQSNVPEEASFEKDAIKRAILGDGTSESWWLYDSTTHIVSANDQKSWVIKSSSGDTFAKINIVSLTKTETSRDISIDFYLQNNTDASFSKVSTNHIFNIPISGGSIYYDFDTATELDVTSDKWDIQVEYDSVARMYNINLNSGISGSGKAGAFGPFDIADSPDSSENIPFYSVDKSGGVFETYPWYAYNLKGNHEIWPNYRIYIIKTEDTLYKLQITSYYHATSLESGWITFYFDKLEE